LRKCPVDADMKGVLYNLALDFERKRQFGKAGVVFDHIAQVDTDYKDVKERAKSAKQASESGGLAGSMGGKQGGTVVFSAGAAKPTLGRYEVEKELGRGAMGVVYLGRDPKINRAVAIKTLRFENDVEPEETKSVRERFFREAESAGTLNHPNIIRIFDAGEDNEIAFIAMELLEGEDLKKYVDKANLLPVPLIVEYVATIADALDYAHAHGVVHRDIKPANVMLLKDGTLRVTDFGIARITSTSKTATGTVLGTPSYMSPEQLSGKKIDGRSDLFSLGVMLYELLTGEKPFAGESIATLLFRIASENHPDPRLKRPDRITASLNTVIDKALTKDPDLRYQRGSEMAKDLRVALKDMGEAIAEGTVELSKPTERLVSTEGPPSL
jgi:serine/threonine protein kinase